LAVAYGGQSSFGMISLYGGSLAFVCKYRPSGKKGSKVTMVPKASNYEWDRLIWILYDKDYVMQEAWEWYMKDYKMAFENKKRLSPEDYRKGHCLYHR